MPDTARTPGRSTHATLLLMATCLTSPAQAEQPPRCVLPQRETGTSAAVVVEDQTLVHTGQCFPTDALATDGAPAEAQSVTEGPAQVEAVLSALDQRLAAAHSGLDQVVKLNVYVTDAPLVDVVQRALAARYSGDHQPAVSFVVTRLPQSGARVAVDAVAVTVEHAPDAVVLDTPAGDAKAPAALARSGTIPQGARIYVSGQAERSEDLAEATRNTLASLRATLEFLKRSDRDIVQLKAFVMPIADAALVQREVAAFYAPHPAPPLVLVEWTSPVAVPIEIELVAWGGPARAGDTVEFLTPPGMSSSPVYSRVARLNRGGTIYISGLYGHSPTAAADAADATQEVEQVFATLQDVLKRSGSDLRHLAKATYYVSTDSASARLNELRPRYYDPQRPPAASKAVVAGVGRPSLGLTLDMIASPVDAAAR